MQCTRIFSCALTAIRRLLIYTEEVHEWRLMHCIESSQPRKRMSAPTGLKNRLLEKIKEKYGSTTTQALRSLARDARVDYTTLARFLLYSADRRTSVPRRRTVASLALALDTTSEWLTSGVKAQQRDIFPFVLPVDHGTPATSDPLELLETLLEGLRSLPRPVQIIACRDAAASVLAATTHNRRMLPAKAYLAMMQLDAMQAGGDNKAVG